MNVLLMNQSQLLNIVAVDQLVIVHIMVGRITLFTFIIAEIHLLGFLSLLLQFPMLLRLVHGLRSSMRSSFGLVHLLLEFLNRRVDMTKVVLFAYYSIFRLFIVLEHFIRESNVLIGSLHAFHRCFVVLTMDFSEVYLLDLVLVVMVQIALSLEIELLLHGLFILPVCLFSADIVKLSGFVTEWLFLNETCSFSCNALKTIDSQFWQNTLTWSIVRYVWHKLRVVPCVLVL